MVANKQIILTMDEQGIYSHGKWDEQTFTRQTKTSSLPGTHSHGEAIFLSISRKNTAAESRISMENMGNVQENILSH